MGSSASSLQGMESNAKQLVEKLKKHQLMGKLVRLQQVNGQYELYSILKSRMQPCEVLYFIETILPQLTNMKLNGGSSVDDHIVIKYTAYIDIYKKLLDNADAIGKEIDKVLNAQPQKAGRRMRMRMKGVVR